MYSQMEKKKGGMGRNMPNKLEIRRSALRKIREKFLESFSAVMPIGLIVLLLHFTIAPMPGGMFGSFLVGLILLIVGMCLFSLGADLSMMPMGERIGAQLTRSKNLKFLIVTALVMGVLITVAEPDLQVLARQVRLCRISR